MDTSQKNHNQFLLTLATCDLDFPIAEWDILLEQSEMTLNMVSPARFNPNISACAYLNGQLNFNAVQLAPPGNRVIIHVNPNMCVS